MTLLPASWDSRVTVFPFGLTAPRETFMYGLAKSTFCARSGVTVKLARMTSTFPEIRNSTRDAASTGTNRTLTLRSSAIRLA